MRFIYLSLYILFFSQFSSLYAQKHDYIWFFGSLNKIGTGKGINTLDFNVSPIKSYFSDRNMSLTTYSASVSDKQGNLMFYTNGCQIANSKGNMIENGDTLSPGSVYQYYCYKDTWGYPTKQSAVILPTENNKVYYIFNRTYDIFNTDPLLRTHKILYSVVDMAKNNEEGKVIVKNKAAIVDTFLSWNLAATKHANGKYWWITSPQYWNGRYTSLLFDGKFIIDTIEQQVHARDSTNGGAAVFSPDGKKYARINSIKSQLFLMDFDRTTGQMNNFKEIIIKDYYSPAAGIAFSPDSRFLYVALTEYIYQFDMQAIDIEASKVLVAEYDGYKEGSLPTYFDNLQLGPDCRIYISTGNGTRYYHYIERPNQKGIACNVVQHGIKLPSTNGGITPYFPNYRLGTLANPGYPCDSTLKLTSNREVNDNSTFLLYPNPANDVILLSFLEYKSNIDIEIFQINGKLIKRFEKQIANQQLELDVSDLAKGFYFIQIEDVDGRISINKFIKN